METNIGNATTTSMTTSVENYKVASVNTDAASGNLETEWINSKWSTWLGYYKKIPELKKAIDAFATWVIGKSFNTDPETEVTLSHITGWGEDTFNQILWNAIVTKKIGGDAFLEIIRDSESGELINLKPLDPGSIKTIVDEFGIIKRYEQMNKNPLVQGKAIRTFKPKDILHLSNDRIADEIHGTSVVEACEWVILTRNEMMADWERISHRATIRVLYIDIDNPQKLIDVKKQYEDAINKGEVLILPAKPGDAEFKDLVLPPYQAWLDFIRYYEDFFYKALGIPKVIIGGTAENTEASAKVGMVVFEPTIAREISELEADLFQKLGLSIQINKQKSLLDNMAESEAANTGQVGFQPSEMIPGRNE